MPALVRPATVRTARPLLCAAAPTPATAISAPKPRNGVARPAALLASEEKPRLATPKELSELPPANPEAMNKSIEACLATLDVSSEAAGKREVADLHG